MVKKTGTPKRRNLTPPHTREWQRGFLAALSRNGNVTKSAELVHLTRQRVYEYRTEHPEFAAQWDLALQESWDRLEHEARRRAQFGTNKPVWYKGELIGFEQEFSDQLMALMLKAKRPDEYGDKLTIKVRPEDMEVFKQANLNVNEAWAQFVEMIRAEIEAATVDHSAD